MFRTHMSIVAAGLFAIVGGCAEKPHQTGFLSSYDKLEPVSSTFMRYVAPGNTLAKYPKFIMDPVTTRFYNPKKTEKLKPEDVAHLEQYMFEAVRKALAEKYQLVSTPGPGVARLRVAITNLEKSNPAMNVLPQTKVTGLGLGQATVEFEMLDSETGTQIAAAIDSQTGSRFSFSGLSKWGDVEAVMDDWAKRLRTRIDEAHNPSPAK